MFFDGVLARVDVDRPGPRTTAGITVGDPESAVLRAYGDRVTRERHAYVESGWYLRVLAPDGRHGITFEIDAGKVISFYAGALPAIQWIEGCA
jgi:hypothetical protein